MSHHFDTPTAREDPRLNLCDFYLFRRSPGTVVMAMTVNPGAGVKAPVSFREEGIYAFRFDLNGDMREDLTFKVRFGEVNHADGDEHKHVQRFEVRRAVGVASRSGLDGEVVVAGNTGEITTSRSGVKAYAGLAPDLFAGDGAALGTFRNSFLKDNKFEPEAFQSHKNYFAGHNVTAIVLELPTKLIGKGQVHAWATVSLNGHAPEVQVSRWGLPLITNIFIPDQNMREEYNRSTPSDDLERFSGQIGAFVAKLTALAGSADDPNEYAQQLIARLCPTTLPYRLDTDAAFDFTGFNGRALADDVMDVMLTLATNTPLGDGVAPDKGKILPDFPYFGEPYPTVDLSKPG
jgi:Domain of unknown function (DUF4331)